MKIRIFISLISLAFVLVLPTSANADSCSAEEYTILTINGVFTDREGARENMTKLKKFFGDTWEGEVVNFDYLHNPSHLAGLGDVMKAATQGLYDDEGIARGDYDLVEMLKDASEKVRTRKLLLVAHSQGNFYANGFYMAVAGKEGGVPKESIGVYSVATPASWVAGGGKWLTSDTDKVIAGTVRSVNFLRNIMEPNVHIEPHEGDPYGHGFSETYLKFQGARIVEEVRESLEKLENGTGDSSELCIDPPKLSLLHKAKGAVLAVADPVAEGGVALAVGTTKGFHKAGVFIADTGANTMVKVGDITIETAEAVANTAKKAGHTVAKTMSSASKWVTSVFIGVDAKSLVVSPALPAALSSSSAEEERAAGNETNEEIAQTNETTNPTDNTTLNSNTEESVATTPTAQDNEREETIALPGTAELSDSVNDTGVSGFADTPVSPIPPPLLSISPGFGGGGAPPKKEPASEETEKTSEPADETPPDAPVIISPSEYLFNTHTIAFSGTAEPGATVSSSVSDIVTATAYESGNWSLILTVGNAETVSFFATDSAGNKSAPTIKTVFVDIDKPDISLSAPDCDFSLALDSCVLLADEAEIFWQTTAEDISFFSLEIGAEFITTTATTTIASLTTNSATAISVSATDSAGNQSATSSISIFKTARPVVINEIAWMGTKASSADEWIELYNTTDHEISLEDWILYADDRTPNLKLSGAILAKGYYLIERQNGGETDEATESPVTDKVANLWTSFGAGLNNGGEELYLARVFGGATTTIDYVPKCSNTWCGGASGNRATMERFDADGESDNKKNWGTALEILINGKDVDGAAIRGTPGARNSISYEITPNGSKLNEKTTLFASKSPYVIAGNQGIAIDPDVTLTIEAGVVIKMGGTGSRTEPLIVRGNIIANGTKELPVVFTSFYDDEYGGDLNGDGICGEDAGAACPAAGDWRRVLIEETGGGIFENTIFRYGGEELGGTYPEGLLAVKEADLSISDSAFEHSAGKGANIHESAVTISNTIFNNNTGVGLYIEDDNGSVISGNTFRKNEIGLKVREGGKLTVENNVFTNNTEQAALVYDQIGRYSGNSGGGNGWNGIRIGSGGHAASSAGTTTLSANDLPYLVYGTSRVADGAILTFEKGTVIKFHNYLGVGLGKFLVGNGGKIYFDGDSVSDLIFTSIYDDTVGGDTESSAEAPAAGDWHGIDIASGGKADLSGFTLRYAGEAVNYYNLHKAGITAIGGSEGAGVVNISNALFEYNHNYGAKVEGGGEMTITDTIFRHHEDLAAVGIFGDSSTLTLSGVTFTDNTTDIKSDTAGTIYCNTCAAAGLTLSPLTLTFATTTEE